MKTHINANVTFFHESLSRNYKIKIAKIKAKLHEKVVLYMPNYYKHIKQRHPEISMMIILSVLCNPDAVYKKSRNSKEFYYQKIIKMQEYRVILTPSKFSRKEIITAYALDSNEHKYSAHMIYCVYKKDASCEVEDRKKIYANITAEYAELLAFS